MIENIEFTNKPKHGIVREVKRRQQQLTANLIKTAYDVIKKKKISEKASIEEVLTIILQEKPELMANYTFELEEYESWATICLATNKIWTDEELDELNEEEYNELLEKSREILGGKASDFLNRYGRNTLSAINEKE